MTIQLQPFFSLVVVLRYVIYFRLRLPSEGDAGHLVNRTERTVRGRDAVSLQYSWEGWELVGSL